MFKVFIKIFSVLFLVLIFVNWNSNLFSNTLSKTALKSKKIETNLTPPSSHKTKSKIPKAPKAIVQVSGNTKITKTATSKLIQFDAKSSYDPDGNDQNLLYRWINMDSNIISDKKSFIHKYDKKGLYETTLLVTDAQNLTAIDRICVLVDIDKNDIPLIVQTGEDQKVNANEKVSLTGRAVCRDDIAKYEWREGEKLLSTKANFTSTFKAGKHTLVLTIEDFKGNKATDSVTISTI